MPHRILPGLCSVTLRACTPEEVLTVVDAGGGRALEWGGDVHLPPGALDVAARLGRQSRDVGVEVLSYGSYWKAGRSSLDEAEVVLDTTEALGADHVRIWCSSRVRPDAGPVERSAIAVELARFAGRAAARSVRVSVELHDHTLTETAASTLALLAEAGAPNLATYWQPLPATVGEAETELAGVLERCSHLHVQQFTPRWERRPLADGPIPWPRLLAMAAGTAPAVVEVRAALLEFVADDTTEQARRDLEVLRAVVDGLDGDG